MSQFAEGFNHSVPIHVRFHDLDALGHVNNARYLNYLEVGRLAYAKDICSWDGRMESLGLIVASVKIDFKTPIHLGDELVLHTRVSRLGNKSFDMNYLFEVTPFGETESQVSAIAMTTLVAFDYHAKQTVPVFPTWREAITAHETDLITG